MVRVKNRYLVVNFLYPEPLAKSKSQQQLPDVVQMHSPTPDALKQGIIIRMIRDGVEDLFGDYGSGMVSSGLKGMFLTSHTLLLCFLQPTLPPSSQLLLAVHQHGHNPVSARPLRNGLGGPHIHDTPPEAYRYTSRGTSGPR